jgi:hypothetical protein
MLSGSWQIYPQDDKMLTVQYYNIKAEPSIFGGDFDILVL